MVTPREPGRHSRNPRVTANETRFAKQAKGSGQSCIRSKQKLTLR